MIGYVLVDAAVSQSTEYPRMLHCSRTGQHK